MRFDIFWMEDNDTHFLKTQTEKIMANNKWKDYLLKSGLPLEYEVKGFLDSMGCVSSLEYSYLRKDENEIINEFSFDIDSAYISGGHYFNLMIECKYRDSSSNWLFLPGNYGGPSELGHTSFLHPSDHFTKLAKFPFKWPELPPIGKACLKGTEITSEGQNPKSITQAVSQLSYAMAEKITDSIFNQIIEALGKNSDFIFYNIPIIVTTANLFRLKEEITIESIKGAESIQEIATSEDCLILETPTGKDLKRHNEKIFAEFKKNNLKQMAKKLNSFNQNVDLVFDVIASFYAPQSILVVQHKSDNSGLEKLFKLMDEIVNPTNDTIEYINSQRKTIEELHERFGKVKK